MAMQMLPPTATGQAPQMVLCAMVVNPDGTVAGAGPLGQMPAGALGSAPAHMTPQTMSMMPDPATVASWGAATMMGTGVPPAKGAKGAFGQMQPSSGGFSRQNFQGKVGKGGNGDRGKGRPADVTTEHDWESLGRHRQHEDTVGRHRKFGRADNDRETADSKTSVGTSVLTDDVAEETELLGTGTIVDNERGKANVVDALKDLKLKVEPLAASSGLERPSENDWAVEVPEEELAWHQEAAEAANKSLKEKDEAPLSTKDAIALAQMQAKERASDERQARRKAEDGEARHQDDMAEEYRLQQAGQARQDRERELAEMERQKQRDAEREAKLQSREAPKLTWSQARALKQQQQLSTPGRLAGGS